MQRQHKFLFATLFAASLTTLTGCQTETGVTPAPQTLTARAGIDQGVLPEQPVTLDGSASTGSGTLTYQWTVVRKPQRSSISLTQATTPKPSFTPDIVGEYELELTVTSGNNKSQDRVVVKAEQTGPLTVGGNLKTQTRWKDRLIDPAKPDYIVESDLHVATELSVDPGVTVAFSRNTALYLKYESMFSADGLAEQRIRFTGVKAEKGFWAGIATYSPSNTNKMAFVDVQYAGSRGLLNSYKAGLSVSGANTDKAQITLTDCQFLDTDGYGLYVQEGVKLRSFARNTFKNNAEAGVLIDAYNATLLDPASTYTGGNGRNVVEVLASAIRGTTDVAWPAFADKTPYRVLGNLAIEAGWTLKPGVTVELARDAIINVNRDGYLSAKGTADQKITFTGSATTVGHWRGIMFYSTSNLNVLEHVELSGAGSSIMVSGHKAAVGVYGAGAKLTIRNSKISNCGGYGILYTSNAELNTDAATINTFSSNAQGNTLKI